MTDRVFRLTPIPLLVIYLISWNHIIHQTPDPFKKTPLLDILRDVTVIFVVSFKYVISSFNPKLKLQKPRQKDYKQHFSPSETMDLFNTTETEGPLMDTRFNETKSNLEGDVNYIDVMEIIQLSIAPVGIIGNLTVIIVFLQHRKLRRKIPNRFIVNQVRMLNYIFCPFWFSSLWSPVMSAELCCVLQVELQIKF